MSRWALPSASVRPVSALSGPAALKNWRRCFRDKYGVFLTERAALYGWSRKRLEFAAMIKSNEKNLAHIINRMANDNSVNAPADAIAYAKNLYRTRSTATQPS